MSLPADSLQREIKLGGREREKPYPPLWCLLSSGLPFCQTVRRTPGQLIKVKCSWVPLLIPTQPPPPAHPNTHTHTKQSLHFNKIILCSICCRELHTCVTCRGCLENVYQDTSFLNSHRGENAVSKIMLFIVTITSTGLESISRCLLNVLGDCRLCYFPSFTHLPMFLGLSPSTLTSPSPSPFLALPPST